MTARRLILPRKFHQVSNRTNLAMPIISFRDFLYAALLYSVPICPSMSIHPAGPHQQPTVIGAGHFATEHGLVGSESLIHATQSSWGPRSTAPGTGNRDAAACRCRGKAPPSPLDLNRMPVLPRDDSSPTGRMIRPAGGTGRPDRLRRSGHGSGQPTVTANHVPGQVLRHPARATGPGAASQRRRDSIPLRSPAAAGQRDSPSRRRGSPTNSTAPFGPRYANSESSGLPG